MSDKSGRYFELDNGEEEEAFVPESASPACSITDTQRLRAVLEGLEFPKVDESMQLDPNALRSIAQEIAKAASVGAHFLPFMPSD